MITTLIIFGVLFLLIGGFWAWRQYLIANMTDEEINKKLRKSRQTYNRLSADERNSSFGKNLIKSILFLQLKERKRDEKKQAIKKALDKNSRNVGNYA